MFERLKHPDSKNLNGLFKRTTWYIANMFNNYNSKHFQKLLWQKWDWPSYVHAWQKKKPMKDNLAFGLHVVLDLFNQDNTFPSEWPSFKENKAKWDITESLLAKST